jgi:hypothetical protein
MPVPFPVSQAGTPVLDEVRMLAALDKSFRERLVKNPVETLKEHGMEIPDNVRVRVVEDDLNSWTFTLPPFVGQDLDIAAFDDDAKGSGNACYLCALTTPICTLGTWTSLLAIKAAP